ncbi:MAG: hypothetical protein ACLFOY_02155 [Desulfatibacillaceae bacterium]
MDRSAKYVEMCGQAPEIQAMWGQRGGDFYAEESDQIRCCPADGWLTTVFVNGQWHRTDDNPVHMAACVWLPRHDQLMEMAQVPGRTFADRAQDFFDWIKRPEPGGATPRSRFDTLEKIWLAFVMRHRFGKFWSGSRWVATIMA